MQQFEIFKYIMIKFTTNRQAFEEELHNRGIQLESVKQTANDLIREANAADAADLRRQLNEVDGLWSKVNKLSDRKSDRLKDALKEVRNK